MKPSVGVTVWKRRLDTFYGPDTLQTLSTYYTDSLVAADMIPVMFPSGLDPDDAETLVGKVDGVLISGGDDVDPGTYGKENTDSMSTDPAADRFEVAVIEAARKSGTPLLAICRGIQILNVALGGTLTQEVTTPGGVHDSITRDHEEMNRRRHKVSFEPDAILASVYGATSAEVNTLHHQGVDVLADALAVEGVTDDGLVEAARYRGDWWALAVQWHPERLTGSHQNVFSAFREAIAGRG